MKYNETKIENYLSNIEIKQLGRCCFIYEDPEDVDKKIAKKGLDDSFQLFEKNYKLAIVSNKNDENIKSLNKIYFGDYIKIAIGQSKDVKRKPAPDMVFNALDELNSDIENAVYVGDSEVDILTAKNANMHCVSVCWGFRDKEFLKEQDAEFLIDEPYELIEFLGEESASEGAAV